MFLNCYQSPIFEVYNSKDAKNSNGNKEKLKHYSKLVDLQSSVYEYNSLLKTYLLMTKQVKLPHGKDSELSLVHPIIGIQGYFKDSIHIELFVVDTKSTRRRIILNSLKKSECKPFFISYPLQSQSIYNNWVTILIQMPSFVSQFKGSSYRSLESILVQSSCSIRRIFTMQTFNESLLSQFQYPIESNPKSFLISFQNEQELFVDSNQEQQLNANALKQAKLKQIQYDIPKVQKLTLNPQKIQEPLPQNNSTERESKVKECEQKVKSKPQKKAKQNKENEFLDLSLNIDKKQKNLENDEIDLKNIDELIKIIEQDSNQQKAKEIEKNKEQNEEGDLINIMNAINAIENQESSKSEIIIKNPIGCTTITKQGKTTLILENRKEQENFVKIIYDPILNCYFDITTNKCYV
ncbi:unnamed protein product (macronuclear) [Paramecium tetraurelia]|uniref:CFA20 domain-containing protein n=1 Tax=Paramecium tetraurelia TaxID=5888 RepID=A0ECZ8_PARTE|nr:uncharacterized protein GSPATT00004034001 [Paramecium tetraurelia]CAK93165.1 unnamed protein product [Paramecium tetraurelia]|eukprot:XP_001460562.1 hypothetical protein (macronuclear) [Paramecium tetraurelia strain d4-2]